MEDPRNGTSTDTKDGGVKSLGGENSARACSEGFVRAGAFLSIAHGLSGGKRRRHQI